MIFHFANLVVWQKLYPIAMSGRDLFFCDSVSFKFLCRIISGVEVPLVPGSSVLKFRSADFSDGASSFFLFSKPVSDLNHLNYFVLPQNVDLSRDVRIIVDAIPSGIRSIYVGISSPKQNLLAIPISEAFPEADIYCVGAVLDSVIDHTSASISDLSGTGLEWFGHLKRNPRRFYFKLISILGVVVKLIFSKNYRRDFELFCRSISTKNLPEK